MPHEAHASDDRYRGAIPMLSVRDASRKHT
jgi:hypothetical protein